MWYGEFYKNKIIITLSIVTAVIFVVFNLMAHVLVANRMDARTKDSIQFQAEETGNILEDLEDGMLVIDESYRYNANVSLETHIELVEALIDIERSGDDETYSPSERQQRALDRLDTYRQEMRGSLAVYSLEKGMLLYPSDDSGRMNIYFNANNRKLLDEVITRGALYGELLVSSALEEEYTLDGYFKFDAEWKWLIFALNKKESGTNYRSYGERITILEGIKRAEAYDVIDAAYVLDKQYYYEYGVEPARRARKMTRVDLVTNRSLVEIFAEHANDFSRYVLTDENTGKTDEKLAYIHKTEDGAHYVVIQTSTARTNALVHQILVKIRWTTVIAYVVLMFVLYVLFQNFVTLTDPIIDRDRGDQNE